MGVTEGGVEVVEGAVEEIIGDRPFVVKGESELELLVELLLGAVDVELAKHEMFIQRP